MKDGTIKQGRREFMQSIALGALLVAVGDTSFAASNNTASIAATPTSTSTPVSFPASFPITGWIRIASDGAVTLYSNTAEIGQGTGTAIAQILANELDLDWHDVRLEMAPVEQRYFNPAMEEYATYGSLGVSQQIAPLRKAGAQARGMLLAAAAKLWKLDIKDCDTDAGAVVNRLDKRRIPYAQLAALAAQLPVPQEPALLPKERWRFIGKDIARLDIPAKLNGSAVYGIDVQMPGLLVAAILQSPSFGGRLQTVDAAPALAIKGVRHVVKLERAVAVVANNYWVASKALAALQPSWDMQAASHCESKKYDTELIAGARAGGAVLVPRDSSLEKIQQAYADACSQEAKQLSAVYTFPFLAHATMEPMNALAIVNEDSAELWLPTQSQSLAREVVAQALGFKEDKVTIHTTLSGGGFGRRLENDFVLQAAFIAKQIGAPVKLIWSREEDIRHDYYRPAAAIQLRASLDTQGMPLALRFDIATEAILKYSREGKYAAEALPMNRQALGPVKHYRLPMLQSANTIDAKVPTGFWRSVQASHNTFAMETFLDELASQAGMDSAQYRRRLLADGGRERSALDRALLQSGWNTPPAAGRFRGMALINANGTVVVHVVELSVQENAVKIHAVTTVVDCGLVVNPRNVHAQMEGGIAFGLSAAFYGEITLKDGAVLQSNFHEYRLINMAEMPAVKITIMESEAPAGGVGEEAVGPIAPAVANALFAATGKRIRDLPFSKSGFGLS